MKYRQTRHPRTQDEREARLGAWERKHYRRYGYRAEPTNDTNERKRGTRT